MAIEQRSMAELRQAATGAAPSRMASSVRSAAEVLPGLAVCGLLAAVATVVGGIAPVVGAPVVAIVLGMVVSAVRRPATRLRAGIAFTGKKVLQGSVVVLGTGLYLGQVVSVGSSSLPVLVGTLVAALAMAALVGRLLGLDRDIRTLVGVGTAICGASAIAATDAVIEADEADVSYSIATIFTFNVVAVLLYPSLGHLLGLSQHDFGLWSGTAINDLSSVVAASTIYGHAAAGYGVIVKLTRTLAIIPTSVGLAYMGSRRRAGGREGAERRRLDWKRVLPAFVLVFVAAVVANTVGLIPQGWHRGLGDLSIWMITAALGAVGLSTDFGRIRQAGLRPLALGAVLWLTVGLVSLGLQAATGTL